ncbi:hypothetical protein Desaci_4390 [Desulfosporosinus acidiphilus SJ4]|uniref:Uncharacterized protein n=1 Tax=Desulfosporosinus acidiphilus (strain DSM 22704 / JCM 16185 / SJ4) TaxID=646529 RepID=I4DBR0_DESAJ|nr:hypothetical protein [Desulfosporosinus acidiphilus]AFM43234.1 hypothetical protein Desaci_4390 [Desulfosporosinus acidiphilus SJ4]
MIQRTECAPQLPATSFSFSILIDSPMRRDLPFSPVSAMILPIASTEIEFASMIVAGLDVLMTFLFKRSLAHPPNINRPTPDHYPITLTLPQLTQLMQAAIYGQIPVQSPAQFVPGQGFGPVGTDEPLFPDNLSVSLVVAAPFAPFDGSPDTSFNVPLFEIPGVPGNLIIALGVIIAQFYIERSGTAITNGNGGNGIATF